MADPARDAVRRWRVFATGIHVTWNASRRTWAEHTARRGFNDEIRLVQPIVFPAFAKELLGWSDETLFAEETHEEGRPDFRPDDQVTHPFVFETKGTADGTELAGHDAQVRRYLTEGAPRIRHVALTNLVGLRVFSLDDAGRLSERYAVNLRSLLSGPLDAVASSGEASRLVEFLEEFSRKTLTPPQKIERVRATPPWNPLSETTKSEWIVARLDRVGSVLTQDVVNQIRAGKLIQPSVTNATERASITAELRILASRLGVVDTEDLGLRDFLNAADTSDLKLALTQYASHVAYYTTTRLMLVRIWEDLGLLPPMLYDGGFDAQMSIFGDVVGTVVDHSFLEAKSRYRALFDHNNNYTWYRPSDDTYAETIYQLANTYLGSIESDVLGQVYERMLERIDRKLRGVYYTPRDIIRLIWDLIDFEVAAQQAEADGRQLRVLDIATGSGGFLVDVVRRLRERADDHRRRGAELSVEQWLDDVAENINGIEYQMFSAYLGELNLLVQLGHVLASVPGRGLPQLGVLCGDTLSFHDPDTIGGDTACGPDLLVLSGDDGDRAEKITKPSERGFLMDVACGNPPYIGERLAAPILRHTRQQHPYWESFVGEHMDYLYWFLILGVSKLRQGGRFGFITTEYWLRAAGAQPLRRYLARRCNIDRIVLFRNFRLFADAPGQHSMILTGTRLAPPDADLDDTFTIDATSPQVSIYTGSSVTDEPTRAHILALIREGRRGAGVRTFQASASPNSCGQGSWAEVILSQTEAAARRRLREKPQVPIRLDKGVETTANKLAARKESLLRPTDLAAVGGPGSRAGIQLLSHSEVAQLGRLNAAEQNTLRRWINSRDVFPYAAVVEPNADRVIYLAKEPKSTYESIEQAVRSMPFPPGLPHLEAHLRKFQPLLEAVTISHRERRPWWTLHRPRQDILGDASDAGNGWAPFCLTDRWGGGGRLIVGLAPADTCPASGLHAIRPANTMVTAAYITALLNSTVYQEIISTIPPGQLRKEDIERLGLPYRQAAVANLEHRALKLARLVTSMVTELGPKFPLLRDELRSDVTLAELPDDVWTPADGPTSSWGLLKDVEWVTLIHRDRANSTRLGNVTFANASLLGTEVKIAARGDRTGSPAVTVTLADIDDAEAVSESLARRLRGLAEAGGTIRDVFALRVPISRQELVDLDHSDRDALAAAAATYREHRGAIDDILLR